MMKDAKRKGRPAKKMNDTERYRLQRANVAQFEDSGEYLFAISGSSDSVQANDVWLVDAGATQHMTSSKKFMRNYKAFSPIDVQLADDEIVQAIGSGDIVMSMETSHGIKKGVLTNVWHIPTLSRNLFSVGRFTKDVGPVIFGKEGCFAETKGVKWRIVKSTTINKDMSYLWHLRHIGHDGLSAIIKKNFATGIDIASVNKWEICDGCALGKQTRVRFRSTSADRASKLLEVIHSDVCGPMKTSTFRDKRYFVTCIDDNSRYCVVYLIKNKSKVVD
ncbi:FOG: Transposon-encoded proteins with TYA, reverse transcriptase, integrase domains in various combinations [Plasmopara halstedii]|uniref:FOG: Transposon-encoded proteins with TYA, reverse transcriptase, integrase domains in various combinations n=1 Tax=Plasmopara halstedii TaxID=4781 RepID=A0A0P1AB46_PLAHL|nr:FOG: Transposon-encoded proteins with TYA, reverse transcriptase, integrase domains in various combinations [Plasmopara halstedii]CEG37391.1 FOG: Transposon-encoded proteins with TYA, reverse transcriptase, integrase domains in various combinations [Plasmopara halstedii]|eukprot:XP_024573760.1 FOG: Transposon-encoded proteins with TYA, reverse transcriptase, integrase domains in various combinations [Plasmopara halstedii]